jgi:DNA-binding NarL/FixJ family response regulator
MTPAKILVVEDEAIVAKDLEYQLIKLGYDVVGCAVSFAGALEEAERLSPDLVLMDIQLRNKRDGIEAARLLRQHYGLAVIFMTAYSDPTTLRRASDVDPAGYLPSRSTNASCRRRLKSPCTSARPARESGAWTGGRRRP